LSRLPGNRAWPVLRGPGRSNALRLPDWKPFFYLLEDVLPVMLVNAHHAKNMPGRKSDVSDAAWLADLGAHGLLRGSLVPPPPIRRLRDLTRARTVLTRDRGRQVQRIEKGPGRQRDQAVLGSRRHHGRLRAGDAGRPHRRA
jgi:transposase